MNRLPMKKLFSLFIFLISSSFLFGQASKIAVFSENGEKFWVVMNGIKQNSQAQTNVKIEGLDQPNYRLRIIFEDDKIKPVDQSVYTKDVDEKSTFNTYVLRRNKKGEMQMKINSYQPLESDNNQNKPAEQEVVSYRTDEQTDNELFAVTIPGMDVNIKVGNEEPVKEAPAGKTRANTTNSPKSGTEVNVNISDPLGGQNMGMNVNISDESFQSRTSTTTTTTTTTAGPKGKGSGPKTTPNQSGGRPKECSAPVSDASFSNMKKSLEKQAFEDTRLKMAKEILKKNCFSCVQLKEMAGIFSFEKNKLELAKFAYDFCSDKGNYYELNEVFSFSSSVDELTDYLSKK
jgi:hypothetical protein